MGRQRRRAGVKHPQAEREASRHAGKKYPKPRRRSRYNPADQPTGDPMKRPGAKRRTHADELRDGGTVDVHSDAGGAVVSLNGRAVAVGPSLQSGAVVVLGADGLLAVRSSVGARDVPVKINADRTVTL